MKYAANLASMVTGLLADLMDKARSTIRSPRLIRKLLLETRLKGAREKKRLKELQKNLYLSLDLVRAYVTGSYRRVSVSSITLIVAGCLYFLNPFDVVVDWLPFGLADDAQVLLFVFATVSHELAKFQQFRKNRFQ